MTPLSPNVAPPLIVLLSSDQETNKFLVYARIEPLISYSTIFILVTLSLHMLGFFFGLYIYIYIYIFLTYVIYF